METRNLKSIIFFLIVLLNGMALSAGAQRAVRSAPEAWGPLYGSESQNRVMYRSVAPQGEDPLARLRYWNEIAINASGLDHTPVAPGENRVFGEQLGPGRAARAIAIVHIAIFDSVNAIAGGYRSYTGMRPFRQQASIDAAIAKAAADTLGAMFPSQRPGFEQLLTDDLAQIPEGTAKANGIELGRRAAAAILALRAGDHSHHAEPRMNVEYFPLTRPGYWRQDPISLVPIALGAHWGQVTPFVLDSPSQFRTPPPPDMRSPEYTAAYKEVKRLGGDGIYTPTERTADQTETGIYWAYDGTPSLCAPPRLYNQIATQIAQMRQSNAVETARLLALINTAMADAGIASWESKFFYSVWRPIGGIRESDGAGGRFGWGDDNPDTIADPNFMPLGAPASNLQGPNFTPPFPAYPSGHATFGGALFQTLRNFYGTDNIPFTFVSDEYNGTTLDNEGNPRPLRPRTFSTFSQAEEENGQSRIYLGIHWAFDKTEGIAQGRLIADHVFAHAFTPTR